MTETATLDEYRDVIGKARTLVVAWRDADARAAEPTDEPRIEWFNRWRDEAITKYNAIEQYLITPNPDMVATRLEAIEGTSRAMTEKCEWGQVAPEAEEPFLVFMNTLRTLWPKFPDNGTPEASESEPLYRILAGEFTAVQPRRD
jgi:hypothetical protein